MGLGSGPATSFGKQADAQASSITEIISSRLFIGSAEAAHQVDLLRGLGIKNVVNCTEMRPFHPGEFAQHACPVSDSPREDISQYFDEVRQRALPAGGSAGKFSTARERATLALGRVGGQ
eukprot:5963261-Prymnesium_polylepis.1